MPIMTMEERIQNYLSDTVDNMDGWEEWVIKLAVGANSQVKSLDELPIEQDTQASQDLLKLIGDVLRDFALYVANSDT